MPPTGQIPLEPLLDACLQGRLIDGFRNDDDSVTISLGDTQHTLSRQEALLFLNGITKYAPWIHQMDALLNAAAGSAELRL